MILYPAIDLKDGQCVRVVHGDLATATVFNDAPADQARAWADAGFHWLHVVDLNGAVEGRAVNGAAVEAILDAVSVPVQLGGGIRTLADIERWIEAGVSRVILGTVAVREPELVRGRRPRAGPSRSPSASTCARARSPCRAGPRTPTSTPSPSPSRFEDAGVARPDRHRHRPRRHRAWASTSRRSAPIADAVAIPVIAAGRPRHRSTTSSS